MIRTFQMKTKKTSKGFWGRLFCRHDWVRTSKMPLMVPDDNCTSAYQMDVECTKCGKTKIRWSDMYLGMRIVEDEEEN